MLIANIVRSARLETFFTGDAQSQKIGRRNNLNSKRIFEQDINVSKQDIQKHYIDIPCT